MKGHSQSRPQPEAGTGIAVHLSVLRQERHSLSYASLRHWYQVKELLSTCQYRADICTIDAFADLMRSGSRWDCSVKSDMADAGLLYKPRYNGAVTSSTML